CPTGAFVRPRELDARRCISYLTIELRGALPEALRSALGDHVFGCDICQEVCPWNVRFAHELPDDSPFAPRAAVGGDARRLARSIMAMSDQDFRAHFKNSPLKRAKLHGLQRNAAVVLGNVGTTDDIQFLESAGNSNAMVREHAAWAIDEISARNNDAP
ncbi:MAG TPA: 4Fe-4S double cluster binding domain-containing protein, partial [Gemmatimonadaceae bacterium]|nr:4Fe-4S double cluster binding domain-containing protein [Gemmatimonadaceae bacterium]